MVKIELSEWAKGNWITKKAVRLLREAIDKKWIPIFNETGVDNGTTNCHLCEEFYTLEDCDGCPILKETGKEVCVGTPYEHWASHYEKKHRKERPTKFPRKVECPECKELAQKEIDWLEALYKKCIKGG